MTTIKPRRSSRARIDRVPILNESDPSFSDLESGEESEHRDSDINSDNEDFTVRPRASKRTPRKRAKLSVAPSTKRTSSIRKKTPLRKGSRESVNSESLSEAALLVSKESSTDQMRIIDVILDLSKKKPDLKQSVDDWNRQYADHCESAIASFFSFLLHLSGCALSFPTSKIDDDVNDPDFLNSFQVSIEEANASFGLLNPNKSTAKRFESRLKLWINLCIELMPAPVMYESDVISRIIEWSTTLSQRSLRTIRLVACTVAFAFIDALIAIRRKLQMQLSALDKSLRQKSKRPAKAVLQMEEDKAEFQSNIEALDQHISAIFQDIFVPRYRDIYVAVRERCLESLRDWILSFESFASDAYFKYFGWALNSSHASVRSLAVRSIGTLVQSDFVRPNMASFLNRFIQRIIEMHNDVDETAAAHSIETCTRILVHDDILSNFESFGDVAPLLWDKSRLIREAAAKYVFEDSFHSDELAASSVTSLQADVEQLFTIYSEASPKTGSFSFTVSVLLDLFFFKLPCLRDRDAIVSALKNSSETRSSITQGKTNSISLFIAQLLLSCAEYSFTHRESHARFSKTQKTSILSVVDSFVKFVSEHEFLSVLKQFQAEPEVFSCLASLIPHVAKISQDTSNISSSFNLCSGVGSALLAFFKRETNVICLRPAAVALASVQRCDSELERDIQQTIAEIVNSLQQLDFSDDFSTESSLFALASLSRVCCISHQVYCPILQESHFFDNMLHHIVENFTKLEQSDIRDGIVENLAKTSHSVILWGLSQQLDIVPVQKRVSRLFSILKSLFTSRFSQHCALAACITADLSAISLNNPQIRLCLNDDIFHLLRDCVSAHPSSLEILKSGARVVCAFCPEHISICAALLSISIDSRLDDFSNQVIKATIGYLRCKNSHVLALAILEALLSLYKEIGIKDASVLSRRMAMSYGVAGASASHFDTIIIGGIGKFVDGEVDSSFLSTLHPFVNRSSISMLKCVSDHIESVCQTLLDDSMRQQLEAFHHITSKKLCSASVTSVRAHGNDQDGVESIVGLEDKEQDNSGKQDDALSLRSGL